MDTDQAFNQGRLVKRELYASAPKTGWWGGRSPQLIAQLFKTVYGLVDGPLEFVRTLVCVLIKPGFRELDLEPCVSVYFVSCKLCGVLGAEVDELVGGGAAAFVNRVLRKLEERFNFHKKECANQEGVARLCGRTVCQ